MTLSGLAALPSAQAQDEAAGLAPGADTRRADWGLGRQGPVTVAEDRRAKEATAILNSYNGPLEDFEASLSEQGLEIVSDNAPPTAESSRGDVSMGTPYVVFDRQAQRYYATAKYRWRGGQRQYFDASSSCNAQSSCAVGGEDGFGMRFNGNVVNRNVNAIFCGRGDTGRDYAKFGCGRPRNPSDNSSRGVTYRAQDKAFKTVIKPDLNLFRGTITMTIAPIRCGRTLQMFGRYAHGWSSTSLDGFSIGSGGAFTLNWSSSDNKWAATSQGGTWRRC